MAFYTLQRQEQVKFSNKSFPPKVSNDTFISMMGERIIIMGVNLLFGVRSTCSTDQEFANASLVSDYGRQYRLFFVMLLMICF